MLLRFPPQRRHSVDLLRTSNGWFLYDWNRDRTQELISTKSFISPQRYSCIALVLRVFQPSDLSIISNNLHKGYIRFQKMNLYPPDQLHANSLSNIVLKIYPRQSDGNFSKMVIFPDRFFLLERFIALSLIRQKLLTFLDLQEDNSYFLG